MKAAIRRWFRWRTPTDTPSKRASEIRFGEYELDAVRRKLRRDGDLIPVAPKAIELLMLLAGQPSPISRDQIAKALWPDNPPANLDAGINNVIRKLRMALNDDAEHPRFVERVPGQGYRFITTVSVAEPIAPASRWWIAGSLAAAAGLGAGLLGILYGAAIVVLWGGVVLLLAAYGALPDTFGTRLILGSYLLATMAYTPSAWSLGSVTSTVVNMGTLGPAVLYPFITGLKFLPIFFLNVATWIVLSVEKDIGFVTKPRLGKTYQVCGSLLLAITVASIITYSGDYRIWSEGLPGRWHVIIGYVVVFAINLALWYTSARFLSQANIANYRRLATLCGIAYVLVLVPSIVIDSEYNQINRHYLDKRRPGVYVATNPDAVTQFEQLADTEGASDIGPDLRSLLKDPEFHRVLREEHFYKQDFDDLFQIRKRAVMYGYKMIRGSASPPIFVIIRFPDELARALRFQYIGEGPLTSGEPKG